MGRIRNLELVIKGKLKECKIDLSTRKAWIDPDKLDFDGEIKCVSPNGAYYFVEGMFQKASDTVDGILVLNFDEVLYWKEVPYGIERYIINNEGQVALYNDENELILISPDGKQKGKKGIGVDAQSDSLAWDVSYFVDDDEKGNTVIISVDMETLKISKSKVSPPGDVFQYPKCQRNGSILTLEYEGFPAIEHQLKSE